MRYVIILLLFLLSNSVNAQHRYDHIELSIRAGLPERRSFFPQDFALDFSNFGITPPEGIMNTQSSLSGELSINWIKRDLDAKTRWAVGFKAGIIPFAVKWYPSQEDGFYPTPIYQPSKDYGERFNIGSHLFTGVTGGMRSRLFTIKRVRMDIVMDLGLIYGLNSGRSTGFSYADGTGGSFKLWQLESEMNPTNKDIGDIFIDFRFGYMVNFPIKDRNVGVGFSGTVSGHHAMQSQIAYFGKTETVTANASVQHVIYALELKYDLVRTFYENE